MQTSIATAIFLVSVTLTLILYYFMFVRKGDLLEFIENNTAALTGTVSVLIFIGILTLGFTIVFLLIAFTILFLLLFVNG